MNKKPKILEFFLLIRDANEAKFLSPDEIQAATMRTLAWMNHLRTEAKLIEGRPLEHCFSLISKGVRNVTATPQAEPAERITGFLLLRVKDIVEAEKIAKSFPTLNFGSTVEIHHVTPSEY